MLVVKVSIWGALKIIFIFFVNGQSKLPIAKRKMEKYIRAFNVLNFSVVGKYAEKNLDYCQNISPLKRKQTSPCTRHIHGLADSGS